MVSEFQRKVFSILFTLKEQNSQILNLLANKKNEELLCNVLPNNFPKLPITNEVDIDNLETLLKSKENLNNLVSFSLINLLFCFN